MQPYLDLLRLVRTHGVRREDRTGTGTRSVFGYQMRFDLSRGFPLVTTKRVWFRGLAQELLWFLSGETNIRPLVREGISIWTDWPLKRYLEQTGQAVPPSDSPAWAALKADFEARIREDEAFAVRYGDLGPVYGRQWRAFGGVDQIARLVDQLRTNPESRRHIVSAWNAAEIDRMALPPCHMMFQCYVAEGRLSCQLYVRSNDLFLGAPFNIAQYALLVHMLAQQCDLIPGELIYTIGDAHIYENHLDQVDEQLGREPYPLPTLRLRRRPPSIFDYVYEDFELLDYRHHPPIKAPVAV
ncbi:thymidylate synthase [Rhodocaloribacter litoris]|uniref:thymidylate synthase n=1 Tax=Rhodocaloribacter litoris TaxID=2558931 RepID=UPI00141FC1D0|nr:thymidylate synthase [Rhodocaloribacter litoris]QXD15080.1 thymidylate synthase [Rhodocaloribacter litoris]